MLNEAPDEASECFPPSVNARIVRVGVDRVDPARKIAGVYRPVQHDTFGIWDVVADNNVG